MLIKSYTIYCDMPPGDHPQTPQGGTCTHSIAKEMTQVDALEVARQAGWAGMGTRHYCPAAATVLAARKKAAAQAS